MRALIKFISINALFFIMGTLYLPIYSSELKSLVFPEINLKNSLIASNSKVKTVITKGFGLTVDEASQNALKNALKQVVGSFIDSETLISKKTEINNGIVQLSKTIKKDTQDYSQGSIKYFEILKTEQRNGIVIIEAKVEVFEGEFSKFIKKFAFAESSFPGAEISSVIETNLNNKKSKAELINNKIIKPLTAGTVYDLKIGDWEFINNWNNFCAENFYYQSLLRGCGSFQNNNVILAKVEVSINQGFLKNVESIFEKTKSRIFYLNQNGHFHATTGSLGKNNDLQIAINRPSNPKIYLFKDIRNEINELRYSAPSISLFNSRKELIFRYSCNVYKCPNNENIKFLPISNGVVPKFSLFGCNDIGNGCVPTIIPNAKYLIMLNFSTDFLKTIKDIKVEYQ